MKKDQTKIFNCCRPDEKLHAPHILRQSQGKAAANFKLAALRSPRWAWEEREGVGV